MAQSNLETTVRRPAPGVSVIDIKGEVTGFAESILTSAYAQATSDNPKAVILNFSGLEYMNSSGIGLLVTLLIRAQRAKQKLMACGLTEHYVQIFDLTRLNEAISIHPTESEAIAAV
jgi:anti-sigma B factor antagonist